MGRWCVYGYIVSGVFMRGGVILTTDTAAVEFGGGANDRGIGR